MSTALWWCALLSAAICLWSARCRWCRRFAKRDHWSTTCATWCGAAAAALELSVRRGLASEGLAPYGCGGRGSSPLCPRDTDNSTENSCDRCATLVMDDWADVIHLGGEVRWAPFKETEQEELTLRGYRVAAIAAGLGFGHRIDLRTSVVLSCSNWVRCLCAAACPMSLAYTTSGC